MKPGDKFSIRTKVIIFTVLSLIAAAVIFECAIENKTKNIKAENQRKQEQLENTQLEENKKAEEEKKQTDKKKILDEKYAAAVEAYNNKRFSDCIKACDEMLDNDAKDYRAYSLKGIAQCSYVTMNRYEEGMKNIDKALEIKGDYGYGRFCKALAYDMNGHFEEALTWYNKAMEVDKNNAYSYYGAAKCHARKNDTEKCMDNLKTAVSLNPEIKNQAGNEVVFNKLKDTNEFKEIIK